MQVRQINQTLGVDAVAVLADEFCQSFEHGAHEWLRTGAAATVVAAALTFVESGFREDVAARLSSPSFVALGRKIAARGHRRERLILEFRRVAQQCMQQAAPFLTRAGHLPQAVKIQHQLRGYVDALLHATLVGHDQVWPLVDMDEERRRQVIVQALFATEFVSPEVLRLAGADPEGRFVPLVWIDGSMGSAAADLTNALVSRSRTAAIVPVGSVPALEVSDHERVVVGPEAAPSGVCGSILLIKRAVAAIREGALQLRGPIINCEEIADELLVADSAMAQMLIRKYLTGFADVRPERRLELGRVLLDWLETRDSIADIGRAHQVPRQTTFNQLQVAKKLIGPAVEDRSAHAGIIVALHAALPGWKSNG